MGKIRLWITRMRCQHNWIERFGNEKYKWSCNYCNALSSHPDPSKKLAQLTIITAVSTIVAAIATTIFAIVTSLM